MIERPLPDSYAAFEVRGANFPATVIPPIRRKYFDEAWSLVPGATLDGDLVGMKPHLEEALGALGRLGRRRDLSETEKMRAEALRMLLASIERARR